MRIRIRILLFRHRPSRCKQKTNFLFNFFCFLLFEDTLTSFFKDKKSKKGHKIVGIKVFLTICAWWLKDPGGPKTCGSGSGFGSGSGTLPGIVISTNTPGSVGICTTFSSCFFAGQRKDIKAYLKHPKRWYKIVIVTKSRDLIGHLGPQKSILKCITLHITKHSGYSPGILLD